jgi:hypothetical protein
MRHSVMGAYQGMHMHKQSHGTGPMFTSHRGTTLQSRRQKRPAAAVTPSAGVTAPRPGAGSVMMKRARKAVGGGAKVRLSCCVFQL